MAHRSLPKGEGVNLDGLPIRAFEDHLNLKTLAKVFYSFSPFPDPEAAKPGAGHISGLTPSAPSCVLLPFIQKFHLEPDTG